MENINGFLDLVEPPSEPQIVALFINDEDVRNSIDASEHDVDELGDPTITRVIEGLIWTVIKDSWELPGGNVVRFLLVNTVPDTDEVEDSIDIEYDEAEDVNYLTFDEVLETAVANEDYVEAARLRDWKFELLDLVNDTNPKLEEALHNNDFDEYFRLSKLISNFKSF